MSGTRVSPGPLKLMLPATSANLGPGFDALGLAMKLYLRLEARVAERFHIAATGRSAEVCGRMEGNLILGTYSEVLRAAGKDVTPLALDLENEIPLGMGCGSSAAALLAGVSLANHFGGLGLNSEQILWEACRREGHPDNVAACWWGGMTASALTAKSVLTATCGHDLKWHLMLVLPAEGLATQKARGLLPATYSRADTVANIQRTALLVSSFALNRPDLLREAMKDRVHQPYRSAACPLLERLLPLAELAGVYGVALSGAGPAVLLILERPAGAELRGAIQLAAGDGEVELLETGISDGAVVT